MTRTTSLFWLLCAMLGLGAAALLAQRMHERRATGPAEGSFWRAVDEDGRVKRAARRAGALRLETGDALLLEADGPRFLRQLSAVLGDCAPGTTLELDVKAEEPANPVLQLTAVKPLEARVVRPRSERAAAAVLATIPVAEELAPYGAPFTLQVDWQHGHLAARLNGDELLGADDELLPPLAQFRLRVLRGSADLLALELHSEARPVPGSPDRFATRGTELARVDRETFTALGAGPFAPVLLPLLGAALLIAVALAGWLAALRVAGESLLVPVRASLRACGAAGAVLLATFAFGSAGAAWRPLVVPLAAAVALVPALRRARRAFAGGMFGAALQHAGGVRGGAGAANVAGPRPARLPDAPSAHPNWLTRFVSRGPLEPPTRVHLFAGAAAVALLVALSWPWRGRVAEAFMPVRVPVAAQSAAAAPFSRAAEDGPLRLDAGNSFVVPGRFADVEVRARVTFAPASSLELRLRAPDPARVEGVALVIGSEPRLGSRFFREAPGRFAPLSKDHWPVPPGAAVDVVVRARGDRFEAAWDRAKPGEADDAAKPALVGVDATYADGAVVLLAARGVVEVHMLSVTPLQVTEASRAAAPAGWLWCGAAAFVFVFGAARLLSLHPLRATLLFLWAALPIAVAFAVPLGGGGAQLSGEPEAVRVLRVLAIGAGVALLAIVPALVPQRRPSVLARVALPAAAAVLGVASWSALGLAAGGGEVARPRIVDWDGRRLEEGVLAFVHPALRPADGSLALHTYRGRAYDPERRPGDHRIVVLGGGAARGSGFLDHTGATFPERLQQALTEALGPRARVDVIPAAWDGATVRALRAQLEEVMLAFAPDVVVFCAPADAAAAYTPFDNEGTLRRATDPRAHRTLVDRLADEDAWTMARRPDPERARRRLEAQIAAVSRAVREAGAMPLFAREPVRDPASFPAPLEPVDAAIGGAAARAGDAVVDLQAALPRDRLADAFLDDRHPSAEGHRRIANALLPVVLRLLDGSGDER